jgi:hypothetical protein
MPGYMLTGCAGTQKIVLDKCDDVFYPWQGSHMSGAPDASGRNDMLMWGL